MKVEFLEQDDEGQHVIAVINGQRKILSTSKTVADILKMVPLGQSPLPAEPQSSADGLGVGAGAGQESSVSALPDAATTSADPSSEIQREDLVKVVNVVKGLSGADGQELSPRQGVYAGGIYRVWKVNQNLVTLPDRPDELTRIVNSLEVIDDKSARPELITLFPNEVVLHQKRKKAHSVVEVKKSEFLKCQVCGETNALILFGDKYEGKCKCGSFNSIERIIVPCENEKCVDKDKHRNQVSLFLTGESYIGSCGVCKTGMEKKKEAVSV